MALRKDLPAGYSKADVALRILDSTSTDKSTKIVMKDNSVWHGKPDGSPWTKEGGDVEADTTVHQDAAPQGTKPVGTTQASAAVAGAPQGVAPQPSVAVQPAAVVSDDPAALKAHIAKLEGDNKVLAERAVTAETKVRDQEAHIRHNAAHMKAPTEGKAATDTPPLGHGSPMRGHPPRTVDEVPTLDEINANNGQGPTPVPAVSVERPRRTGPHA